MSALVKVLEIDKIPIHMVVGTSAGSVIGSLYAYGNSALSFRRQLCPSRKATSSTPLIVPTNGFIKGDKLEEFIKQGFKDTTIDRLKIPFYAVATEYSTAVRNFSFPEGTREPRVRASSRPFPAVFRARQIGELGSWWSMGVWSALWP